MRYLIVAVWMAMSLLAACSSAQVSEKAQLDRPDGDGDVRLLIEGLQSVEGLVYASIYLSPEGFPENKQQAHTYQSAPAASAADGAIELSFEDIPAGWLVIAVLHDSDGNEELSLSLLGIPEEQYGFSRNPDSVFGPPKFDEAAVFLESGEQKALTVRVQ